MSQETTASTGGSGTAADFYAPQETSEAGRLSYGDSLGGDNLGGIPGQDKSAAREPQNESLLVRGTEQTKTNEDSAQDASFSAHIPDSPQGYDLGLPKHVQVDQGLAGDFQKEAFELGLSQGQAKRLAGLYSRHAQAAEEAQGNVLRGAVDGWEREIQARPAFREDRMHAQRVLAQYGGQELNDLMNETFIGSHPVMFEFMTKIGKALAEPSLRGRGAGGDGGLNFYPSMRRS